MSLPTLLLDIAWADDPLTSAPTWTAEGTKVRSIAITRGRQDTLGRWEAGTLTVVLENLARRFEPFFSGSPLFPNVVPRKRIRVRASTATTTHNIFNGHILDISPEYSGTKDATVTITAADGFAMLAQLPTQAVYSREVLTDVPTAWYRFGEAGGSTTLADSSGNGRDATVSHGTLEFGVIDPLTDGVDAAVTFDGNDAMALPTAAGVSGTGNFSIEMWLKADGAAQTNDTIRYIYVQDEPNIADANELSIQMIKPAGTSKIRFAQGANIVDFAGGLDNAWHHFVFERVATGDIEIIMDGVFRASTVTAGVNLAPNSIRVGATIGGLTLRFIGSMDELATYQSALGVSRSEPHFTARLAWDGLRVDEHVAKVLDQISWPAGSAENGRDLAATLEDAQGAGDLGGVNVVQVIDRLQLTEDSPIFMDQTGRVTVLRQDAHRGHRERSTKSQVVFSDLEGNAQVGAGAPRNQVGTATVAGDGGYQSLEMNAGWEAIKNHITVTRRGNNTFVRSDPASIVDFGQLGLAQTTEHAADDRAAIAADRLLARHKEISGLDIERLELRLSGSGTDDKVLQLELWDAVEVQVQPPGGGAPIYVKRQVQGISHNASPTTWTATLDLARTP